MTYVVAEIKSKISKPSDALQPALKQLNTIFKKSKQLSRKTQKRNQRYESVNQQTDIRSDDRSLFVVFIPIRL